MLKHGLSIESPTKDLCKHETQTRDNDTRGYANLLNVHERASGRAF